MRRKNRTESRGTRAPRGSSDRGSSRSRDRSESRGSSRERGGRSSRGGGNFTYRPRSADDVSRRQQADGNRGPSFLVGDHPRFTPADGDNLIRILPPTWDDAEHFGLDAYVHYGVGPEEGAYLCPKRMKGEPCAVCDAADEAAADGDEDLARELNPAHRVLYWVIDRDNEKEGPKLWASPYRSIDKELAAQMVDRRTGEVLNIDDPENGYDVEFTKTGKGQRTRYEGLKISRHSSELGRNADDWLEVVVENPLPELLAEIDSDLIEEAFAGGHRGSKKSKKDDDYHGTRGRHRGRGREEEEAEEEEAEEGDGLTWDELMVMAEEDFDSLCEVINDEGIDIDPDDYPEGEEQELAEDIAAELGIEKPAPKRSRRSRR